jgi:hypothetical protein
VDSKSYQSAFKKAREAPGLVFSWARRKKSLKNASYSFFIKILSRRDGVRACHPSVFHQAVLDDYPGV